VCGATSTIVEIFNVGNLDLIVDQVQALPSPGPFVVQPLPSTPVTLRPGAAIAFTVTFLATTPGASETGTLRITSNDPIKPTFDLKVTATAGAGALATAIADHGDFGEVCTGTFRDEALTLANNGSCPLKVTDIVSSSPSFLSPAVASYPLIIAPGTAIEMPIRFQPAGIGSFNATITIHSGDLAGPKVVRVAGTAPAPRLASMVAGSGNLGKVCVGKFADESLTLSNSGACSLSIAGITSSSPEFLVPQVSSFPIQIGAGDFLPVPIRFQPSSFGLKTATITVVSNDPASPSNIAVSGEAPSGKITVTGSTCFGEVTACSCAERVIAICNVGECHLHVSSVKLKRRSRHWKLVNNPFPATLHPGSCLNLVIRYKATEQCPRSQDLIITSDDPVTPVQELALTACTLWEPCSCKKCCDDCRARDCDRRHGECQRRCCCDDENDRHDEDEDDDC
jgi:hypothetical protein